MTIKDMRDKPLNECYSVIKDYPPNIYRMKAITSHKPITESKINQYSIEANNDNADCMIIFNYGIQWLINFKA